MLGVSMVALSAAVLRADDAPARAHAAADIATLDGANAHWIQGQATVTLPKGWALDADMGKKDTDLQVENAEAQCYLTITTTETEDFTAVGDKMVEGMMAGTKGSKLESKKDVTVAGFKAHQRVNVQV